MLDKQKFLQIPWGFSLVHQERNKKDCIFKCFYHYKVAWPINVGYLNILFHIYCEFKQTKQQAYTFKSNSGCCKENKM